MKLVRDVGRRGRFRGRQFQRLDKGHVIQRTSPGERLSDLGGAEVGGVLSEGPDIRQGLILGQLRRRKPPPEFAGRDAERQGQLQEEAPLGVGAQAFFAASRASSPMLLRRKARSAMRSMALALLSVRRKASWF
jgi:hypothetical protein